MSQHPRCEEGPCGGGEKAKCSTLLFFILSYSWLCGLHVHHKSGRRLKRMDSNQALGELPHCQPLYWPKLSHLVWSSRAEAGKCVFPYSQRENEQNLVNARNCHHLWDSLIWSFNFADGENEGRDWVMFSTSQGGLETIRMRTLISYSLTSLYEGDSGEEKERRRRKMGQFIKSPR